jgi:hypothetical protein
LRSRWPVYPAMGKRIVDALEETGTWAMVAYHKRSDPAIEYAKAEIERLKGTGRSGSCGSCISPRRWATGPPARWRIALRRMRRSPRRPTRRPVTCRGRLQQGIFPAGQRRGASDQPAATPDGPPVPRRLCGSEQLGAGRRQ